MNLEGGRQQRDFSQLMAEIFQFLHCRLCRKRKALSSVFSRIFRESWGNVNWFNSSPSPLKVGTKMLKLVIFTTFDTTLIRFLYFAWENCHFWHLFSYILAFTSLNGTSFFFFFFQEIDAFLFTFSQLP